MKMRRQRLLHGWTFTIRQSQARRKRTATRPAIERLEERLALATLPPGFSQALVTTNSDLLEPMGIQFSPTGELWALEKAGKVKLIRNDGTADTAATLTVNDQGERGLMGIAFDPKYDGVGPNADYVYLHYTTPDPNEAPEPNEISPAHNRVSRFTVTGAGTRAPGLGGELVLRELPAEDLEATNGSLNHNGGAIHFGRDGKLYVGVGDHDYKNVPQSPYVSQDLTTPFGKLLRLNPDGTNPADNPFYSGSATDWQGSIWALGLRNPYSFAIDPASGRLFINDVGEDQWEEINEGQPAANYGWAGPADPVIEGFQSPPPTWANYRDPVMAVDHSDSAPSPFSCSITGGLFYPKGGQFGSEYAGKYFFVDFCGPYVRVFDPANPGSFSTPDTSTGFGSDLTDNFIIDLKIDSAGRLYYVVLSGEIYRISRDETDTVGVYNPEPSTFFLKNVQAGGPADINFTYGAPELGWTPVTGDWNADGIDTVGLFEPHRGEFFLRNENTLGTSDLDFQYGPRGAGWLPIVGDWDGDGRDTVGLFNPRRSVFYLKNSHTAGNADLEYQYGAPGSGWLPLAGDWNKDGIDTVALFNPTTSVFHLRNEHAAGIADVKFHFGQAGAGWLPLAGDWNGDRIDTAGLYNPASGRFFLRNEHAAGPADRSFHYGAAGQRWLPLVGDWDGTAGPPGSGNGLNSPAPAIALLGPEIEAGITDLALAAMFSDEEQERPVADDSSESAGSQTDGPSKPLGRGGRNEPAQNDALDLALSHWDE